MITCGPARACSWPGGLGWWPAWAENQGGRSEGGVYEGPWGGESARLPAQPAKGAVPQTHHSHRGRRPLSALSMRTPPAGWRRKEPPGQEKVFFWSGGPWSLQWRPTGESRPVQGGAAAGVPSVR